jgi:hypothetical protein
MRFSPPPSLAAERALFEFFDGRGQGLSPWRASFHVAVAGQCDRCCSGVETVPLRVRRYDSRLWRMLQRTTANFR